MRRTLRAHGRRTAAALTAALALTATAAPPARAEPATLTEVRAELERLYHDAEIATDNYNAADEKVTEQSGKVRALKARIAVTESRLDRLTELAGAAARAQYRGGGLPAEIQFVLADDPERALDNASLTRRSQQATQGVLTALSATRDDLATRNEEAAAELRKLRTTRRAKDAERRTIEKRIGEAKRLESRLAREQAEQLAALDRRAAAEAQAEWVESGVLDRPGAEADAAGRKAIAYATRQIGKPYVWGAEGPDSFDCSGLTLRAWEHAGVLIPRTSQEQWRRLKRVPVPDLRPGDLVIYFAEASHVALYIGGGEIIHAPRPGRDVTVAPAGSMEILGVVRPGA